MSCETQLRKKHPTKWLTVTAMLMAMNVVMSSFSIPVPGGHLYLNDAVICTAAILLDPLGAFIVGGVGAFLGDFFFYPAPMFVSLVTHGLQAVVISLCAHKLSADRHGRGRGLFELHDGGGGRRHRLRRLLGVPRGGGGGLWHPAGADRKYLPADGVTNRGPLHRGALCLLKYLTL